MSGVRVLLVEDDARIASFVRRGLEAEGYAVDAAGTAAAALGLASGAGAGAGGPYPLVILDRLLPDADGLEVCRALRAAGSSSLVLMLTARDGLQDKIDGLKGGADDYLTKPFAFDELLVRLEALLRRAQPPGPAAEPPPPPPPRQQHQPPQTLTVGDLRLDLAAKAAWRGGRRIALTAKEFALLAHLMANAGAVVGRPQLLSDVWGLSFDPGTKVIDVYIRYLRRKVDGDGEEPLIRTVRGFGYTIG